MLRLYQACDRSAGPWLAGARSHQVMQPMIWRKCQVHCAQSAHLLIMVFRTYFAPIQISFLHSHYQCDARPRVLLILSLLLLPVPIFPNAASSTFVFFLALRPPPLPPTLLSLTTLTYHHWPLYCGGRLDLIFVYHLLFLFSVVGCCSQHSQYSRC